MNISIAEIYAKINAARAAQDEANSHDVVAYFYGKILTVEEILSPEELSAYRAEMATESAIYAASETV